jgi:hypothetical protein
MYKKSLAGILLGLGGALALLSVQAIAAPVACPVTLNGFERQMWLDPTQGSAACDGVGTTASVPGSHPSGDGWIKLAEVPPVTADFNVTGLGADSGTVFVDLSGYAFGQFFLVFNFSANVHPIWIRYQITPNGNDIFAGDWWVEPRHGLSSVFLYARDHTQVPAPASLGLLGMSILALGLRYRLKSRRGS